MPDMYTSARSWVQFALSVLWIVGLCAPISRAQQLEFAVTVPRAVLDEPFTGKVLVYLSKNNQNPRNGPNWFRPEPIYSADFKDVPPGTAMVLTSANTIGFPGKLSEIEAGEWNVQAVVDRNRGGRAIGSSPGNIFSTAVRMTIDPASSGRIEISPDQIVPDRTFRETNSTKSVSYTHLTLPTKA
jgi:hypothetical protein